MKYKNYIFDLYGTLVDIKTDEEDNHLWEEMTSFFNDKGALYTQSELKMWYKTLCHEEFLNLNYRISFKTNKKIIHQEINVIKVFQRMYAKKGITPSLALSTHTAELFRKLSTKYIHLYDGVVELLTDLKASGGQLYLLSNAQQSFTKMELEELGLIPYFHDILLSSDYQHKKPDIHFFEALLEKHSLIKSESIMIGNDLTSDIKGAHDIGIDSLYMNSNLSPNYSVEESNLLKLATYTLMETNIPALTSMLKEL